jgi:predicted RNA-binding protein with TRAM domain
LNKEVTNLDFRITLEEGWNYHNSSRVIPYVKKLYYTEVTPAINYLYSDPIANPNNILEYILGTDYDDFDKAKLTWGICQGNSTNWNDYEEILSFKNGILANRQKSFKFTNPVVFDSLVAVKSSENDYNYVVFNNGQKFTWNIIDTVQVTVNNTTLPSTSYRTDNVNGNIVFVNPVSSGNTVEVKITKPKERYQSYGEGTVTSDYVNYYLVNGRWPNDSNIVVLVDNVIQRNNFKTDRESGSIIFDKKQSLNSKVTVSIFGSDYYRIGLKVEDYDSTSSKIYNFGLTKNTVPNSDIIFKLNQTPIPSVKSNSFVVDSDQKFVSIGSSNQLSLASRMYLDYVYESGVNSKEYYPRTKWYRSRTSGLLTTTIELDSAPNYRNRIVQKKSDLLENNNYFIENDVIYATIEPFDSIDYGIVYTTDNIILKDIEAPFVYDVQIKSLSDVINNTISSLSELQAFYIFNNSNFGTDQSLVEWFEWTNGKTSKILEGSVLNSSYVTSGKAFSFKVTPYNGQIYGIPIESSIINII